METDGTERGEPEQEKLQPLSYPLGEAMHHTDAPLTEADRVLGDVLAWHMGDLFLDSMTDAPVAQWAAVARALRIHGLKIVNAASSRPASGSPKDEKRDRWFVDQSPSPVAGRGYMQLVAAAVPRVEAERIAAERQAQYPDAIITVWQHPERCES